MAETEHATFTQQQVVAQADNDGDADLAQQGMAQTAGKHQRSNQQQHTETSPCDCSGMALRGVCKLAYRRSLAWRTRVLEIA